MSQLAELRKDPCRHYAKKNEEWLRYEFWYGVFTGVFFGFGIGFFLAVLFLASQAKP